MRIEDGHGHYPEGWRAMRGIRMTRGIGTVMRISRRGFGRFLGVRRKREDEQRLCGYAMRALFFVGVFGMVNMV